MAESPRGAPGSREPEPKQQDSRLYYQAAIFRRERRAKRAYFQCQETVLHAQDQCDLSMYRLLINEVRHVVVLGDPPPEAVAQRIQKILSAGESVTLPSDNLQVLQKRRAQVTKIVPWVEGHYRPGEPL